MKAGPEQPLLRAVCGGCDDPRHFRAARTAILKHVGCRDPEDSQPSGKPGWARRGGRTSAGSALKGLRNEVEVQERALLQAVCGGCDDPRRSRAARAAILKQGGPGYPKDSPPSVNTRAGPARGRTSSKF